MRPAATRRGFGGVGRLDLFRVLVALLLFTLVSCLWIASFLDERRFVAVLPGASFLHDSNALTALSIGKRKSALMDLKTLDRDVIIFLHLHKSGGTFFVDLASSAPGQVMPKRKGGNALLFCPPRENQTDALRKLCGNSSSSLLPFWSWSSRVQEHFLAGLNYTFVANERWLGPDMVLSAKRTGKAISASRKAKYVTIIRDPLDRIISHFFYAYVQKKTTVASSNKTLSRFIKEGPCQTPDAGFQCWDSNYYVQAFAGVEACATTAVGRVKKDDAAGLEVSCGEEQLEAAKQRLKDYFIVLHLDWLPISGPLLCSELGLCGPEVESGLNASLASKPCGVRETLAQLHGHDDLLSLLESRNALDLRLYDFAKGLAEEQLRAVGVAVPPNATTAKQSCFRRYRRRRRRVHVNSTRVPNKTRAALVAEAATALATTALAVGSSTAAVESTPPPNLEPSPP